jgi:ATP-binding cassette subfamily B protein
MIGDAGDTTDTTRTIDFAACRWPAGRRAELERDLGVASGLDVRGPTRAFELTYADVAPVAGRRERVRLEAPAVLRVGGGAGAAGDGPLLGVVACGGHRVRLLAPDGAVHRIDAGAFFGWLRRPAEAAVEAGIEATILRAGISGPRGAMVRDALLAEAIGGVRVAEGARLTRGCPTIWAALRGAGAAGFLGAVVVGRAAELALLVLLWRMIGRHAVGAGSPALGWNESGVGLVVVSGLVGARLTSSWAAGRLAVDGGAAVRDRLIHGILALDTAVTRSAGIGQLLGRIVDIESIESLALGGGLLAMTGLVDLGVGLWIVALGAVGGWYLVLAAAWAGTAVWLGARVCRALGVWSTLRLGLTHDLVERMVGQRTTVAQEPPELRHRGEDRALAGYAEASRALDRAVTALAVVLPRGWLISAVAILAPVLLAAGPSFRAALEGRGPTGNGGIVVSLGGVLLVYAALRGLARAFPALGTAAIAARNLAPLVRLTPTEMPTEVGVDRAAGTDAPPGARRDAPPGASRDASDDRVVPPAQAPRLDGTPLMEARHLAFRYPGRRLPVLEDCAFEIRRGDRVLLEGPSGGGKSTLGALLCGLRRPTAGYLAYRGAEQGRLGADAWRAEVGAAPQFHENHVFSASLAFNLLLGRGWPPRGEDLREAEAVLRELGLGPLLDRMPSGLGQVVGESGWQLSQGERSRVFIARSLLQPLSVRVLDESFAALDPETLERALGCVLRRAETLVVIAHP